MRETTRTRAAVAAAVAVVSLLLGGIAFAASGGDGTGGAARTDAGVSLDGDSYDAVLDGPLFGSELTWGPGDSRVTRLWVRGHDENGADGLTVRMEGADTVADLVDDGLLAVHARIGKSSWSRVVAGEPLALPRTARQQDAPVAVRVAVSARAPKGTAVHGDDVDVSVMLGRTALVGESADAAVRDFGPAGTWVVPLGLLLLSAGAYAYSKREPVALL